MGAVEAWVFMHIIGWKMFGSKHVSHYTFSTLDLLQIDLVHYMGILSILKGNEENLDMSQLLGLNASEVSHTLL